MELLGDYALFFGRDLDELWEVFDYNDNGELQRFECRKFVNELCKFCTAVFT